MDLMKTAVLRDFITIYLLKFICSFIYSLSLFLSLIHVHSFLNPSTNDVTACSLIFFDNIFVSSFTRFINSILTKLINYSNIINDIILPHILTDYKKEVI